MSLELSESLELPERTFSFFPDDSFLQSQSQSTDCTLVIDELEKSTDFTVGNTTPEKQKTFSRNTTPNKKSSQLPPSQINVRRRKHGSRKLFANKRKFCPPVKGDGEGTKTPRNVTVLAAPPNDPSGLCAPSSKRSSFLSLVNQSPSKGENFAFEVPKLPKSVKPMQVDGDLPKENLEDGIEQSKKRTTSSDKVPVVSGYVSADDSMQVVPDDDILSSQALQAHDQQDLSPRLSKLILQSDDTIFIEKSAREQQQDQKQQELQQLSHEQHAHHQFYQPQQLQKEEHQHQQDEQLQTQLQQEQHQQHQLPKKSVLNNRSLLPELVQRGKEEELRLRQRHQQVCFEQQQQHQQQQPHQHHGLRQQENTQDLHQETTGNESLVQLSTKDAMNNASLGELDRSFQTVPCLQVTVPSTVHDMENYQVPSHITGDANSVPSQSRGEDIEPLDMFSALSCTNPLLWEGPSNSTQHSQAHEVLENIQDDVGRVDSSRRFPYSAERSGNSQVCLDGTTHGTLVRGTLPQLVPNVPVSSSQPKQVFNTPNWQMSRRDAEGSFNFVKQEVESPYMRSGHQPQYIPYNATEKENMEGLENHLLRWVVDGNTMIELQKQCSMFQVDESECIPVYELSISIDVQSLIDYHEQVGSLILKSPVIFCYLLKQVCFNILKSNGLVGKLYSQYQVIVTPSYSNTPSIAENTIASLCNLSLLKKNAGLLFQIKGMVIGMSSLSPYTKCAKYICPEKDCVWSKENCYIISSNVASVENDLIRNDFPCSGCGNMLKEDIAWRKSAEKRYCFVIPKVETSNLQNMYARGRSESIKVVLKDRLKDAVDIGGCYSFTGVFKHDVSNEKVRITFEVLSVMDDIPFLYRMKNFQKILPDSLCSLYQDRKSSPWSFVASLAYCFLGSVVPPGTYYLFKYCLLLSLIIGGGKTLLNIEDNKLKYNHLNLLVNDEDVLPYQRMMIHASSFTDGPVVYRVPMDLFGSITQHDSLLYVDGGTLALASTNVCILPNMLELKKKEMDQLKSTLENAVITVNVPKKQHEQVQQNQFQFPLMASVWACNQIQVGVTRDYLPKEVSSVPPALTSLFNLVFNEGRKKNLVDMDIDVVLSDHVLDNATGKTGDFVPMIPQGDFREYICHVRRLEVEMSKEAFKVIKTFYLVSRRICADPSLLPQTTLQTLLSLAAAHAKAMLFRTVTVNNAIAAIYIFEQLSSLSYGESTFGVLPVIHFLNQDISKYLGPENDEKMFQFKRSLVQYCSYYYPEVGELVNPGEMTCTPGSLVL